MFDKFIEWFNSERENIDNFFDFITIFVKNLLDYLGEWPIEI